MTEQDWLTSNDPAAMLRWLTDEHQHQVAPTAGIGRGMDRRLRLFACAACRAVWDEKSCDKCCWGDRCDDSSHYYRPQCPACHGTGRVGGLTDPRSRKAVEVAERYADGEATEGEMLAASNEATVVPVSIGRYPYAAVWASQPTLSLPNLLGSPTRRDWPEGSPATQAALLRDVFGNTWRKLTLCGKEKTYDTRGGQNWYACAGCQSVLRWHDGTVPRMAQGIYDDRRWENMPILGDALMDSGCDCQDIIDHCRNGGHHARGCWVLDLILGRS